MRATSRMPSAAPLTANTTNKKKLSISMMSEHFYPSSSSSSSSSSSISKAINNSSSSKQEEQKNVENDTDDDEYNRAVAFLRDFHSKRVACYSPLMQTPLHLSSLDSILENDDADEQHQQQRQNQLEDLLSSDFALALNVGSSSSSVNGSSSTTQLAQSSISPYQSRLKKVATSKCLLSLVEDDTTSQCPSMVLSTSDSELSSSSATSIDSSTSSSSSSSSLSCSSSSCVGTNQEVWFPMI